MKQFLFIIALLLSVNSLSAQQDSTKNKNQWRINGFGLSFMDGNVQFFDGYNYEVLYSDAQFGLPLYSDWNVYSGIVLIPDFFQVGAHVNLLDTTRGLKLRLAANYAYRKDSLATTSGFAVNDTIFGRNASEEGEFWGVTVSGMKQTRKLMGFLRLYGGAEVQVMFSPRSDIFLLEFSYDVSESQVVDANAFRARGKARFNLWGRALLGVEAVFADRIGVTAEVKAGLGSQLVLGEKGYGMAANAYQVGLNYYLWDYNGRPSRATRKVENRLPPPTPLPGS